MKYKWLNNQKNENLIIFFNGWGMNEEIVNHLTFGNFDVIMFYDYNSLKIDFDFENFNIYKKCHLIAWSMGVMISTLFNLKYDSATAINGTLYPIDDNFGIPKKIYELTLKNFNPESSQKFVKNMFKENSNLTISRDFENIKSELNALKNYESNKNFKFTKVLLSSTDKIIPTKNQMNYWHIEPNLNCGHAPFNDFKSWGDLI